MSRHLAVDPHAPPARPRGGSCAQSVGHVAREGRRGRSVVVLGGVLVVAVEAVGRVGVARGAQACRGCRPGTGRPARRGRCCSRPAPRSSRRRAPATAVTSVWHWAQAVLAVRRCRVGRLVDEERDGLAVALHRQARRRRGSAGSPGWPARRGRTTRRILCGEWQSTQAGILCGSSSHSRPSITLRWTCSIWPWQVAQVSATLSWWMLEAGSSCAAGCRARCGRRCRPR